MSLFLSRREILAKIWEAKRTGRIFTVCFVKRTNGEFRRMNCRGCVQKGVLGIGMKYDPNEMNLISVFDMQKQAFRMINSDTVTELSVDGQVFSVEEKSPQKGKENDL